MLIETRHEGFSDVSGFGKHHAEERLLEALATELVVKNRQKPSK